MSLREGGEECGGEKASSAFRLRADFWFWLAAHVVEWYFGTAKDDPRRADRNRPSGAINQMGSRTRILNASRALRRTVDGGDRRRRGGFIPGDQFQGDIQDRTAPKKPIPSRHRTLLSKIEV